MKAISISNVYISLIITSTSLYAKSTQDALPGLEVKPKFKYYFTANLEYEKKHHCSGAFLNGNTVVTAASCIKGKPSDWTASYKRHNIDMTAEQEKSKTLKVLSQAVHPEYVADTKAFDVSVWKVDAQAGSKAYVILDDGRWANAGDSLLDLVGWGLGPHYTNIQREIQASVIRGSKCRPLYQNLDNSSHFCVSYPQGTSSYCQFEPGSPILINKNGEELLVGIAATETCIDAQNPGIFVKSGSFVKFVKKFLEKEMPAPLNGTSLERRPQRILEKPNKRKSLSRNEFIENMN